MGAREGGAYFFSAPGRLSVTACARSWSCRGGGELPRSSRCRAHHHESRDKHDDRARRRLTIEERVRRADRERLVQSEPPIECPRITSPVTAVASHRRRAPQTARTDPQRGSHRRRERLDRVATAPRVSRRQRRTPPADRSSPPWPRSHDTDRQKRCGESDADRDLWQRLQARRTPRAEGARARRDAHTRRHSVGATLLARCVCPAQCVRPRRS